MAFEEILVRMPDGSQFGPATWDTLRVWVQEQRIPADAIVIDNRTGEARTVAGLARAAAGSVGGADEGVSTIIPYRNAPALIGYYLGVFSFSSLIPLLGIVGVGMGIAALILGLKGLKNAKANPRVKGTAHAWVAIICGSLFGVIGVVWQVFMVIAVVAASQES